MQKCDPPHDALLRSYDRDTGYVDCYRTVVPGHVSLARFIEAFYTTRLFKAERMILCLGGHPSTDAEAASLASGAGERFAAWYVEERDEDQILLCDVTGRTRSWFKVRHDTDDTANETVLYFGSAITAVPQGKTKRNSIGPVFKALTGFHILYSKALLAATRRRIQSSAATGAA